MFKSNYERKMRYSIRKFSVGVASVAVASLFMGSVAHASELVKDDSVKTTEVAAKPYPSMAQTDQGNNSSSSELETTKMEIPTTDLLNRSRKQLGKHLPLILENERNNYNNGKII